MKIVPVHHNISAPVNSWAEIKKTAEELRAFANNGPFLGEHKACYALHHSQVEEHPFNFFAMSDKAQEILGDFKFPHWCIINPKITPLEKAGELFSSAKISTPFPETFRVFEGCMSWPFRKHKKVVRDGHIFASFQIPGVLGLKTINCELFGLTAQIFQHECDHGRGKTIYD